MDFNNKELHTIIEVSDLTKSFKRYKKKEGLLGSIKGLFSREYENKLAVNGVSLKIDEGEFVGLIGPNGAGKTTLIKMLTGIIEPSSGKIEVLGYYPNDMKNEFKKQYAIVMGQKSQLFYELTANDTLRLFKEIYGLSEAEFKKNRDFFVELFEAEKLLNVQVRTLSLGERMKLEIMVALLHNPKLLFLDEPTIGLDAIAARQIRNFLCELNKEMKTTILLTSHYMEDIKTLCDRSIILKEGQKIYDGKTDELIDKYQTNRKLSVEFDTPVSHLNLQNEIIYLEDMPLKKVLLLPKAQTGMIVKEVMTYSPKDIKIEEEEIGSVVERIYGGTV